MLKALFVRLPLAAVLLAGAACTVSQQKTPDLVGPSEYGTSVTLSATPDSLMQDGSSRSTVIATVRNANGQPVSGVALQLQLAVGGSANEFGYLSARTIYTGSDGRASSVYTPPYASPFFWGGPSTRVSIQVRPVGSDFQTAHTEHVDILVTPPPLPQAAPDGPTAVVTASTTAPKVGNVVNFNASGSMAGPGHSIVNYFWDFGDGQPNDEHGNDASHVYSASGTYTMTLGVVDELGQIASTFKTITVTP